MEKVLVIGAGFLGRKLVQVFSNSGFEVEATSKEGRSFLLLDITDKNSVETFFEKSKPKIVLLTASLTNVDYCEQHSAEAEKINVFGAKNVIDSCKKSGAKLVFYSTDFVFDGKKGNYSEKDKTNPLCVYARTKLEAEKLIEKNLDDFLILRTSTLYGFGIDFDKIPFTDWVIESLKSGKSINCVSDQITCPTLIDDLAKATLVLVQKNKTGLYHAVGSEPISRFDFAKKIAKVFESGKKLKLINEVDSSELNQSAKRPANSSLDISKLKSEGIEMSDIETGLKLMKNQMAQNGFF